MRNYIKKISTRFLHFVSKEQKKLIITVLFYLILERVSELPYINTVLTIPNDTNFFVVFIIFIFILFKMKTQLLSIFLLISYLFMFAFSVFLRNSISDLFGNVLYFLMMLYLLYLQKE
jgi:hypothetical protein